MTPEMQKLITLLRQEIGYKEQAGGYTKFGDWYNAVETDSDYSDQPWCDMFLSWGANHLGYSDWFGEFSYTVAHAQWFQARGAWGREPQPGAVVFFDWSGGGSVDGIDHVGLVTKVNGDTFTSIEGNTSNQVMERSHDLGTVVGFGYPEEILERTSTATASGTDSNDRADTRQGGGSHDRPGTHTGDDTETGTTPGADTETRPGTDKPDTGHGPRPDNGSDTRPGLGTDTRPGIGSDSGSDAKPGTGTDTGSDPGSFARPDLGPKLRSDIGSEHGTGTGTFSRPGTGTGTEIGPRTGTATGTGTDAGTGTDTETDTGTDTGTGTGTGTGTEPGTRTGTGTDIGPGIRTNTGAGISTGIGPRPGSDTGPVSGYEHTTGPGFASRSGLGSEIGPKVDTRSGGGSQFGPRIDTQSGEGSQVGPRADTRSGGGSEFGPRIDTRSGGGSQFGPGDGSDAGPEGRPGFTSANGRCPGADTGGCTGSGAPVPAEGQPVHRGPVPKVILLKEMAAESPLTGHATPAPEISTLPVAAARQMSHQSAPLALSAQGLVAPLLVVLLAVVFLMNHRRPAPSATPKDYRGRHRR